MDAAGTAEQEALVDAAGMVEQEALADAAGMVGVAAHTIQQFAASLLRFLAMF
ncbi:MAG: hypothetical protein FWB80_04865 [Defluviitaleaceae bacterium]|nr:hypothetical protein [Defluviitaleaceae bacterium]